VRGGGALPTESERLAVACPASVRLPP